MFRPAPTNIAAMTGNVNYDAAAVAYFAAVVTAGGTLSTSDKTIYNTLFAGLRTDGLLSILDRLSVAAPTATPTLVDLISLTTQTPVNSPSFVASQGYAGDGATSYINTGFTPGSGHFALGSASFGVYTRTSRTGTGGCNMGCSGGEAAHPETDFYPHYTDGNAYLDVVVVAPNAATPPANVQGMWVLSRTSSTIQVAYQNGSAFNSPGSVSQGASLPNTSFSVGANTNGSSGAHYDYSTDQNAAWFIGGGLNATQAANLTTRVNNFFTSYGTNVF